MFKYILWKRDKSYGILAIGLIAFFRKDRKGVDI